LQSIASINRAAVPAACYRRARHCAIVLKKLCRLCKAKGGMMLSLLLLQ
jgi:hypothetical protein